MFEAGGGGCRRGVGCEVWQLLLMLLGVCFGDLSVDGGDLAWSRWLRDLDIKGDCGGEVEGVTFLFGKVCVQEMI